MEHRLKKLDELMQSDIALNGGGSSGSDRGAGLTWDDLIYLPELRTLSCVEGLTWSVVAEGKGKEENPTQ